MSVSRLREAVVRWRGGVRYGGATVVVSGKVENEIAAVNQPGRVLLHASGTHQRIVLRSGVAGLDPADLPAGALMRITGRVVKGSEGNENEIWLELERVEPGKPAR